MLLKTGKEYLRRIVPADSIYRRAWRTLVSDGEDSNAPARPEPAYLDVLDSIEAELDGYLADNAPSRAARILMGPSFSIYPPCFVHDRILSCALQLRGAEIIPIYCDAAQSVECNVYGGNWTSGMSFAEACMTCVRQSQRLWRDHPHQGIRLSSHLSREDHEAIARQIEALADDTWHAFESDGLPFGRWACDILVNNYLVGDHRRIPDAERLGRAHLRNLLLLNRAYERIIDNMKPDRIVANDSYYGMWAILQELAARRGIPFYSHWSGTRPNAWCYAMNDASMNLDFRAPWPSFSAQPMAYEQIRAVETWLEERTSGKGLLLDVATVGAHQVEGFDLSRLQGRPTALLAANLIWDLSALNKQVVFADMMDWIAETIRWFGKHPEFNLIVKPHPGEMNPAIPETVERVNLALHERGVTIPDNVVLLTPKSRCSVYDLFPLTTVGLVHTTTAGVEMVARGIPVITSARSPFRGFGFTTDPESKDEYFDALARFLAGEQGDRVAMRDLAYKYILFNMFHYYMRLDIMDFAFGQEPVLRVNTLDDVLPGKRPCLDYAVESILEGLAIVSETRWPPQS